MKTRSNNTSENSFKHEILVCKRCNKSFECKVGDISRCQCKAAAVSTTTIEFLEKTSWGCLCVNCLKQIDRTIASLRNEVFPTSSDMKEGIHFYIENGLFVFTERYHLLRGTCCESGCRHCPFGFRKAKEDLFDDDPPKSNR